MQRKRLLRRGLCVLLALALLAGACPFAALAVAAAPADDAARQIDFALGCRSEMMLSGGGKSVQAGDILYFIDSNDGRIYRNDGETTALVRDAPAACLNYLNDRLFFAETGEDGFRVLALDPLTLQADELLGAQPGTPRQLYITSRGEIWYAVGDTVFCADFYGAPKEAFRDDALFSFVPTGAGLIAACGTLFDLTLLADGAEITRSVEDYAVLLDPGEERLVYSKDGAEYQIALAALFGGTYETEAFDGYGSAPVDEVLPDYEAELLEPAEELPELELHRGEIRGVQNGQKGEAIARPATLGMVNTAKRAYQMTDVRWTPILTVKGWTNASGNSVWYQAGTTYQGIPYGWPYDVAGYVPWNKSLTQFVEAVNNSESDFYTKRSSVRGSTLCYATDCSGFVSWAWQAQGGRHTCTGLMARSYCMLVSSSDYALAQIGDALISGSHTVLISNIKYDSNGAITVIELAEANVTPSTNWCANRRTYGEGGVGSLASVQNYFRNGYKLYRNANRETVTFTENPYVPVAHDSPVIGGSNAAELHKGVDVSEWQGQIDWKTLAPHIDFAIIRCNYSFSYQPVLDGNGKPIVVNGETLTQPVARIDERVEENIKGCIENDIPYGIYVYAKATKPEEAMFEASIVLETLLPKGYRPQLPIFYDVEDNATIFQCSNEQIYKIVEAFCSSIEDVGFRAGVYCSTSWWESKLPNQTYSSGVKADYTKWCRWVAQYYRYCEYSGGMNLWQSSGNGSMPGISTPVDIDYWFGKVGDESHMYIMDQIKASCTDYGYNNYASTDGKVHWSEELPMIPHDYQNGKCTMCGAKDPDPNYQISFSDVPNGAWFYDSVEFVVRRELFNGTSASTFAPQGTMTRGMLATVLWRLAGSPAPSVENPFSDVDEGRYFTDAVRWAYETGVVNGTSPTTFNPNGFVTRQQTAAMLYRYAQFAGYDTADRAALTGFPDHAGVANYAKEPMSWAVAMGLIGGVKVSGKDYLQPGGNATRAQVATILMRFVQNIAEAPEEVPEDPPADDPGGSPDDGTWIP